MQNGNGNGAVGTGCNLPGKFVAPYLVRANLRGVILIGKRRPIDVKGDRGFGGIESVTAEVDTRAERRVLVLFRSSLQFVTGREIETLSAVDLHRVVTIAGEDDKSMRVVSVIRHSSAVWEQFLGSGEDPCACDGRRLSSGHYRAKQQNGKKRETLDRHEANVPIERPAHNLIVLNALVSATYAFLHRLQP